MKRIPEPELMLDKDQALAYAQADFSEPHNLFVELFSKIFPGESPHYVLDLGCGTADISTRFAKAYPHCTLHGIDGSQAMLQLAKKNLIKNNLEQRIQLSQQQLPSVIPISNYDAIISNALLHHLQNPQVLWDTIKNNGMTAAPAFVMDLIRPDNQTHAQELVQKYVASEAKILQRDFFRSLLSAYHPNEVQVQLKKAQLNTFELEIVSDRHFVVYGRIP